MADKLVITKDGVQTIPFTQEELQQREADRLQWEEEQSKPQPPTLEEQIAEKDRQIQLLKEQQLRTDADLSAFMDFVLMGGM